MSVLVRIPTPLRAITKGQGELQTEAANIQELIDRLEQEFAGIKARLCEDNGSVRRFINIYLNEEDIRFLQGLSTALKPGDEVSIGPAIAGGTGTGDGLPPRAGGARPRDGVAAVLGGARTPAG
jgi:molybdopterin synthase sulfur carrier subunit